MLSVDVVDLFGSVVGKRDLNPEVFGIDPNYRSISDLVRWQNANSHTGTRCTKTRSTVTGTGKKNFRQKGTGSARRGSLTVSQFRGGGIVFGPLPVERKMKMNKKERALAMRSILSLKLKEGRLFVLDSFNSVSKTKEVDAALKKFGVSTALFVGHDEAFLDFALLARNIASCDVLNSVGINGSDIISHEYLFLSKPAVDVIEKRFVL